MKARSLLLLAIGFITSKASWAATPGIVWSCKDTLNDSHHEITVDVEVVFGALRPYHQMMLTIYEPESLIPKKQMGPILLSKKKSNPQVGVVEFAGNPLSFYLGSGDDKDHLFGQLFGTIEDRAVRINLNCRDLKN